jgi:hypothetical protein
MRPKRKPISNARSRSPARSRPVPGNFARPQASLVSGANRGRRAEALHLLAPIYGWFTEGFDTRDLNEAKTMLDALA